MAGIFDDKEPRFLHDGLPKEYHTRTLDVETGEYIRELKDQVKDLQRQLEQRERTANEKIVDRIKEMIPEAGSAEEIKALTDSLVNMQHYMELDKAIEKLREGGKW